MVIVSPPDPEIVRAFTVTTSQDDATDCREKRRRQTLKKSLEEPDLLPQEKQALLEFLTKYHHAFSLEDGERGEIDLIYMEINTGEARPKKQRVRRVRRVPFALRQVVAGQLAKMQRDGVIQPSRSPWSSPVVLVKKRDGTHRFCIDYRALNSVTKPDSFPLSRIEDLLDQLGGSTYFSTIDLASGFWQIRMHPDSQQKTAFSTQQGLFEFWVMPFGLTNAPAVFERLMQQVVAPLNPSSGPDFVSVYLDDILVFSRNLGEHMVHLTTVIEKLAEAQAFQVPLCKERAGISGPCCEQRWAEDEPPPCGSCSSTSLPLNHAPFTWSPDCQTAFEVLKRKLVTSPVLAYPNFKRDFLCWRLTPLSMALEPCWDNTKMMVTCTQSPMAAEP